MIIDRVRTSAEKQAASRLTAKSACFHNRDDWRAHAAAADVAKNAISPYFISICDLSRVEPTK